MAGLAWFLALVLATSALQKCRQRERFGLATARLTGLDPAAAGRLALAVAALEAVAALLLVMAPALGAVLAGAIWLAYAGALQAARARGDSLDCGCGPGARVKPVDRFMVGRALVLAALAGLTAGLAAAPPGIAAPGIEPLFAALGLFTLHHLAGEIAALPPLHRKAAR